MLSVDERSCVGQAVSNLDLLFFLLLFVVVVCLFFFFNIVRRKQNIQNNLSKLWENTNTDLIQTL